jgi:hypothetical protein
MAQPTDRIDGGTQCGDDLLAACDPESGGRRRRCDCEPCFGQAQRRLAWLAALAVGVAQRDGASAAQPAPSVNPATAPACTRKRRRSTRSIGRVSGVSEFV